MVERGSILIVERDGEERKALEELLVKEYDIVTADDGKQALSEMQRRRNELAAVILDWETSAVSAFQLLQVMQARGLMEDIQVFVTTSQVDPEIDKKVYALEVKAVVRKPYEDMAVRRQILDRLREAAERRVLRQEVKENKQLLEESQKKLEGFYGSLLDAIGTIMEYRVSESDQHVRRIKGFARIMAVAYRNQFPTSGLNEEEINRIVRGSVIHDIGKIAVPDTILLNPAKLTEDETQILRSHTTKGEEIVRLLKDVQDEEQLRVSCEICRWHHERYDGGGYPDGLEGDEIPISAQIVAIVDVYDELVSERISKKPYDKATAYSMIMKGECGAFAPKLLQCFESSKKLLELYSDNN
ncbi:MAG: HD domain-containing protein [bacterium]|nr:HD domain-containing protein [bacterium]MCM1376073.1 HD domain-containing protein [Muribaculum sp.]